MPTEEIVAGEVTFSGGKRRLFYRKGSSDEGTIEQILIKSEYDLKWLARGGEILNFLGRQDASGRHPIVIDAGANIGASAVFFRLAYPTAHIIAIEPDAGNFDLLRRNVDGLNVQCILGALSASPGRARLIDPGIGHWGYRTEPAISDDGIICTTIPELYGKCPQGSFPFIVKIDIEGGEAGMFDDATWVDETPVIIIEPHDWLLPKAGTFRSFLRCVADRDRDFVIVGENVFSIRNEL